jgi:phytoene synthase
MSVDHYENFPVASLLMPRRLHKPIKAIYRFARAADDIADEGELDEYDRLCQLEEFHNELENISEQKAPRSPLFQDLAVEIALHKLPLQPFYDLLDAFTQDVTKRDYENFDDLQDYCRRSANPVGTLLLHLYDEVTPANLAYSDAICTALQLINFWQDVAKDFAIGRIYLPQDEMEKFGVTEEHIAQQNCDDAWRALMQFQVDRARGLMKQGTPLGSILTGRIGLEARMIIAGGSRILTKLESKQYDMFRHRPVLNPLDWALMFAQSAPLRF